MKPINVLATVAVVASMATGASAQANLTAETASPTGVPGNTVRAGRSAPAGVANIQVTGGQTLSNWSNLAEGKIDISAAPFILPFLMSRGAGPFSALAGKGASSPTVWRCSIPIASARLRFPLMRVRPSKAGTIWKARRSTTARPVVVLSPMPAR